MDDQAAPDQSDTFRDADAPHLASLAPDDDAEAEQTDELLCWYADLSLESILDQLWLAGYDIHPTESARYPSWMLAEAFLFVLLTWEPVMPARAVAQLARKAEISDTALRRARKTLRVVSTKRAGVRHGGWWWCLPPELKQFPDLERCNYRWGLFLSYRAEDSSPDVAWERALAELGLAYQTHDTH